MPFRQKVKRAFGRNSSTSSPSSPSEGDSLKQIETARDTSLKHVDTKASTKSLKKSWTRHFKKDDPWKDWPENIYKPHEMPRPKYRRPVDPKHAESLEAYSFEKAFETLRRRSKTSLYSPMGSRLPSRIGSIASRRNASAPPSRSQSISEVLVENEAGDDDVANVGLSRQHTHSSYSEPDLAFASHLGRSRHDTVIAGGGVPDLVQSSSIDSDDTDDSLLATSKTVTNGDVSRAGFTPLPAPAPGKPLDEEELARELTRALTATQLSGRVFED